MYRIDGLLDRVDTIQTNKTVQLVVGVVNMEVNGYIISLKSSILEDLVTTQSEIYMDQFTGEEDSIQDCIYLLYGRDVLFNNNNIKTIMKFSVVYQVHDIYELCMDWTKVNMSAVNLCYMIELGLLIEVAKHDNHDVLDLCKNFIMKNIKDDFSELSKCWSCANNINFIRFLVQTEILYFTLPIITSWINNDSDIRLILEQFEVKELTQGLFKRGSRITDLIDKMSDRTELVETSRKIHKLSKSIYMEERAYSSLTPLSKAVYIASLQSENTVEQLLCLEEEYGLEHFQFVEIALSWIVSNTPKQEDVMMVWSNIRQSELEYSYLVRVRDTIMNTHNMSYTVPDIEMLSPHKYYSNWGIHLTTERLHSLTNNLPVVRNMGCKKCGVVWSVNITLEDKCPCYVINKDSHCLVKHWSIVWVRDSRCYLYSLITNNYNTVLEKIKECLDNGDKIVLRCLYKCRDEEQTLPAPPTNPIKKLWKRMKGGQV